VTTAALDTQRLMISRRLEHVKHHPICFFYIDDYLPSDLYQSLHADYPKDVGYSYDQYGKMGFRSSETPDAVQRFCAEHPSWQKLIEFFSSDEFLDDVQRSFAPDLAEARGLAGRRRWINCNTREAPRSWLRYQLQEPVRTTFQFSLLPKQAAIVPHRDAPRKLISLLLYFRDPEWKDAYGGDTEYYVPRDPRRARKWDQTARIPFDEFKPIGQTAYVGNRLTGFVRSAASWHGVPPISCPDGLSRKALLINIKRLTFAKRHVP
jgi:hypothetical protein